MVFIISFTKLSKVINSKLSINEKNVTKKEVFVTLFKTWLIYIKKNINEIKKSYKILILVFFFLFLCLSMINQIFLSVKKEFM